MDPNAMNDMFAQVVSTLKPYNEGYAKYPRLPVKGVDREAVLTEMELLKAVEQPRWKSGYVSGTVYYGDEEHSAFLARAYSLSAPSNPLHPDVWPSLSKYEAEIVSMTAGMLGADRTSDEIVGTVTSGGTESLLLAMKTYRDWARGVKGIAEPEIVAPTTAHVAFDKAAHYFDMRLVRVPVGPDFRADVAAMEAAITPNTAVLVGSAPPYPHGLVDPIDQISELARSRGLGCHTDACMGGFILPWAEKLGYPVPPFDFRLPGVTSVSADTHKYGYAAKGTSVLLYRGSDLRRYQYYTVTDWPGGIYLSPTMMGSRPGGLIAACWAALVSIGEQGYLEAARRILETATFIKDAVRAIPELEVIGDPLFIIAFRAHGFSIYKLMERMAQSGWRLNGLNNPPAVHFCVTLPHTQPGVKEKFVADLHEAVAYVKQHPDAPDGLAPLYAMGATVEMKGMADELLALCLDLMYQV